MDKTSITLSKSEVMMTPLLVTIAIVIVIVLIVGYGRPPGAPDQSEEVSRHTTILKSTIIKSKIAKSREIKKK
jgi:uncharacterized membrane protein